MIHFDHISYARNSRQILKNISFHCTPGETMILLGGSGSGKSTILKLILGLITATSGEITFQNKNINEWNLLELRRQAGYMIQNGGLFPHLTTFENASLVARFLQRDSNWINERMAFLLDLVHLDQSYLKKLPHEMSGGENQRVALTRALFLDPTVLFFDEPLSALDPITRADLQNDLKDIFNKLQKTVILVTHDLSEATFLGQKLILLRDGVIEQSDSVKEFIKNPKTEFARKFLNAQNRGLI